jgi:hypothetical protein
MEHMGKQRVYPEELKQRAARMVLEWRAERNRTDGGIKEVAEQLGGTTDDVNGVAIIDVHRVKIFTMRSPTRRLEGVLHMQAAAFIAGWDEVSHPAA